MEWLKQERIMVKGRRVKVENANYRLNHFIPEIDSHSVLEIMNQSDRLIIPDEYGV